MADLDPEYEVFSLGMSIDVYMDIFHATSQGDSLAALFCNYLGALHARRYKLAGELDDLQAAITWAEVASQIGSPTDLDRVQCQLNLCDALIVRYTRLRCPVDIEYINRCVMDAYDNTTAEYMTDIHHNIRQRIREIWDEIQTTVTELHTASNHSMSSALAGNPSPPEMTFTPTDANNAIILARQIQGVGPRDYVPPAQYALAFAVKLNECYSQFGIPKHLHTAISLLEQSITQQIEENDDFFLTLSLLGRLLCSRFELTRSVDDLSIAIEMGSTALQGVPEGNPRRLAMFLPLLKALDLRYTEQQELGDVEEAIRWAQEAVAASNRNPSVYYPLLFRFSHWMYLRFQKTGDAGDLDVAISTQEEIIQHLPVGDTVRTSTLLYHMSCTKDRYYRTKNERDRRTAASAARAAMANIGESGCEEASGAANRGQIFLHRYIMSQDRGDLDTAIALLRQAVDSAITDRDRSIYKSRLALALTARSNNVTDTDDIEASILLVEENQQLGDYEKHSTRELQDAFLRAMQLHTLHIRNPTPHNRHQALKYLRNNLSTSAGHYTLRIRASMRIVDLLAEENDWMGISQISEDAVHLLPRLSPRLLNQHDQQALIEEFSGLASDAAAAALLAGKSAADALGLLELGRGVIANHHFQSKEEHSELKERYPAEAEQLAKLRTELYSPPDSIPGLSMSTPAAKLEPSPRHSTNLELDTLILKIRQFPGFENFLLPPRTEELARAASAERPCVVVNVSRFACHAIIIQDGTICARELPNLKQELLRQLERQWRGGSLFTTDMFLMFAYLWESVARPVLEELGYLEPRNTEMKVQESQYTTSDPTAGSPGHSDNSTQPLRHVCWIPTGSLCVLPIHAAGYHCDNFTETVLDNVVSSYSPSVKALLYAQRNRTNRSITQSPDRFLLTCMETTPGMVGGNLPYAKREVDELQRILGESSMSSVVIESPTKSQILSALPTCDVFHFAGHGHSNPVDPSRSSLALGDGPLTVQHLMAMRLHLDPPFLAYLSACSTGDNASTKLQDESIHLMSACQLAGFQHVIGTLWEVSDSHCVDVAKEIYGSMLRNGMTDASVAIGLHQAVLNLRGGPGSRASDKRTTRDVRLVESGPEMFAFSQITDPRIWASYIHMGL